MINRRTGQSLNWIERLARSPIIIFLLALFACIGTYTAQPKIFQPVVSIINAVQDHMSSRTNISQEEAVIISRQSIGPGVVYALPFKNRGSRKQHIAAVVINESITAFNQVFILSGGKALYEVKETQMNSFVWKVEGSDPPKYGADIEAVDLDRDGYKEIYSSYAGGGSSIWIEFLLFDTRDNEMYSFVVGPGECGIQSPLISDNLKNRPTFAAFMEEKANEIIAMNLDHFKGTVYGEYCDESVTWEKNNGKGFYKGKPVFQGLPGPVILQASVNCEIEDGNHQWIAYFKGPVYLYDKARDHHWMIYLPDWDYSAVRNMVLGKHYLWLGLAKENGIVALNLSTATYEVFLTPEIMEAIEANPLEAEMGLVGSLSVKENRLYFNDVALSLPENLNLADEFQSAKYCK